jgi:FKBP-type peptidyl-prolyl cis-trans isomerase
MTSAEKPIGSFRRFVPTNPSTTMMMTMLSFMLCFISFVTLISLVNGFAPSGINNGRASTLLNAAGEKKEDSALPSRRDAMLAVACTIFVAPSLVSAAVTDETDSFANTDSDSSYRGLKTGANIPPTTARQSAVMPSDEFVVSIPKGALSKGGMGLELGQLEFRTNIRVYVKSVTDGSIAEQLGIKKDLVVVGVNGESTERTNAEGVAIMVFKAAKNAAEDGKIELRFRDPAIFKKSLAELSNGGEVTTQIAPAGDTTQRRDNGSVKRGEQVTAQEDQRLTVTQIVAPKMCNRGATTDDLLEISYLGTVVETGAVFDGSAIRINGEAIPGRGNDVSLFFVLGKQPFGQFPPGWDVGLDGICIGERRRLVVPPVLAYGSTGLPRRGIPPNSTLQYDITLVSINGLAMPQ